MGPLAVPAIDLDNSDSWKREGPQEQFTLENFLEEKIKGVALIWKPKCATPFFVPRYKEKVEETLKRADDSSTREMGLF
jgi:hypothetical protein